MKKKIVPIIVACVLALCGKPSIGYALQDSSTYVYAGSRAYITGSTEANIYTTVPRNTNMGSGANYYYLEGHCYNNTSVLVGVKEYISGWWLWQSYNIEYFTAYKSKGNVYKNDYYSAFGPVDPTSQQIGLYLHPSSTPGHYVGEIDVPTVGGIKRIPSTDLDAGIDHIDTAIAYVYSEDGAASSTTDGLYHWFWGFGYCGPDSWTGAWGWHNAVSTDQSKYRSFDAVTAHMQYRLTGDIANNGWFGAGTYIQ